MRRCSRFERRRNRKSRRSTSSSSGVWPRCYVLDEQYAKAADCAGRVIEALKEPKRFGLDEEMTKQLLSGPRPPQSLFGEYFLLAERPDKAEAAFHEADRLGPEPGAVEFSSCPSRGPARKPEPALTRLEASFEQGLTGQGLEPYELLAELLDQLGKKDELVAQTGKAAGARARTTPAWATSSPNSIARPGSSTRRGPCTSSCLAKQPSAAGYAGLAEIYRKDGSARRPPPAPRRRRRQNRRRSNRSGTKPKRSSATPRFWTS